MAKKRIKKPVITAEIVETKKYTLIRDYPTSKGVLKKGKTIEATKQGAEILTKQKYI